MAINDTTALGLPAGRSAARRRRTLTGQVGPPAPAQACPADVDATPLHPLVADRATPALVDGAGGSIPVPATTTATTGSAPHQALLALLEAHNAVAAEVSLAPVLQRVVEAAREITGARYATITLCTPDGSPGTRVDSGVREKGLSGVPSGPAAPDRPPPSAEQRPSPARPPGRSRYRSLSVPVTAARGSVLGHLRVSGPPAGRLFSADDEDLVTALAMTAGIAVQTVRSTGELQRRQEPPPESGNGLRSPWLRGLGDDECADLHPDLPSRVVRRLSALGLALRAAAGPPSRARPGDPSTRTPGASPPEDPGPRRARR